RDLPACFLEFLEVLGELPADLRAVPGRGVDDDGPGLEHDRGAPAAAPGVRGDLLAAAEPDQLRAALPDPRPPGPRRGGAVRVPVVGDLVRPRGGRAAVPLADVRQAPADLRLVIP